MAKLFISCVSNEFGSYREVLRKDFTRHNLEVAIQEDFVAFGAATLEKLDAYIQHCAAVIHICGDMTGSMANALSVQYIKDKYPDMGNQLPALQPALDGTAELSYTQWEAWLAVYHNIRLFVVVPDAAAARDRQYVRDLAQMTKQQAHLAGLRARGFYDEIKFKSADDLVIQLYKSKLGDILKNISPIKPSNLPYQSIGSAFKGRDQDITDLKNLFAAAPGRAKGVALHALGGMGKTRLAVEYALLHESEYTALFFVSAAEAGLTRDHIGGLAAGAFLNLPEQAASDADTRFAAVLRWLNEYKGWLLILDNADTPEAAAEAEKLFSLLHQGHVLITSRLDTWSPQLKKKQLELLSEAASIDFLLESTNEEREKRDDDKETAGQIADDLGCLALALEQARAYIVTNELSLAGYRKRWQSNRAEVLTWFDEQQMHYPASLAITWQTSFAQLSAAAHTLLNRLAWMAPEPLPKTILDVRVPDVEPMDAEAARAELKKYSLAASAADKKTFTVHRLVQEITRSRMDEEQSKRCLREALDWMDTAFTGEPDDVRSWPVLEPLVPHVLTLLDFAKANDADKDCTRLMNNVALLFDTKAQYGAAEPFYRRSLELEEKNSGSDHPMVATLLNNLAALLKATDRLTEAEPMMRRVIEIFEKSYGPENPNVAVSLNNLGQLLKNTNRPDEAEPLMRRALDIDEKSFGPDHPDVAIDLNNLAQLLQATNRLEEAEPMMRRALAIDEQSYGPDHPNVARDLNNLGQLLKATNRPKEAEPLMKRSLIILLRSYGAEHPQTNTVLNNYVILLEEMGKTEEEIKAVLQEMANEIRSKGG